MARTTTGLLEIVAITYHSVHQFPTISLDKLQKTIRFWVEGKTE